MESDQRGQWSACFTPILPPESCQLDQCPVLPPLFCGAAAVIADFSYLSCSSLRSHSLGQFFSSTASTNSLARSGAFTSEAPLPTREAHCSSLGLVVRRYSHRPGRGYFCDRHPSSPFLAYAGRPRFRNWKMSTRRGGNLFAGNSHGAVWITCIAPLDRKKGALGCRLLPDGSGVRNRACR